MSLLHLVQLPFVASGLVVGALVGLTGVGGGSLMTPLLVLLFGIHPATAVGTDLLYAGLTKLSGSTVHSLHGSIEWRVVRRLALGSAPMAVVTLLALKYFGAAHGDANSAITTTLGVGLLLTSASLLFRPWLVTKSRPFFERLSDSQIAAPSPTRAAAVWLSQRLSKNDSDFVTSQGRNNSDAEVSSRAMPKVVVIAELVWPSAAPKCLSASSVATAMG